MRKYICKSREGLTFLIDATNRAEARKQARCSLTGAEDSIVSAQNYVDIFKRLRDNGIPHAVCKNASRLIGSDNYSGSDWFVMIMNNRNYNINNLGFRRSDNKMFCMEYDLKQYEIKHFKHQMQLYYHRVKSLASGKVWEEVGKPFKDEFAKLGTTPLELSIDPEEFTRILEGHQTQYYRGLSKYWGDKLNMLDQNRQQKFDTVVFSSKFIDEKEEIVLELKEITVGKGRSKWGGHNKTDYYVLNLGKLISSNY